VTAAPIRRCAIVLSVVLAALAITATRRLFLIQVKNSVRKKRNV